MSHRFGLLSIALVMVLLLATAVAAGEKGMDEGMDKGMDEAMDEAMDEVAPAFRGPAEGMGYCTPDNPAAAYCVALDYKCQSTATDANCIFPDGSSCEIWAFFRGTCGQKFSYCETHGEGNTVVRRMDDMGTWCAEYAVCVFPQGFECAEYDYYMGQCKPGQCQSWILSKGGCVNCSK